MVSVVIVSWNGRAHLEKCLESLSAQTYPQVETILVDNGSTDGTVEWVLQRFPAVRLIANLENLGFAAANNQAIRQARGDYIATLNNDAWAEPDWLSELVRAVEWDPRTGMAGSQMVFAQRPDMINSTGICLDRAGVSWDRAGGEPVEAEDRQAAEIFGPCAGAALYRKALFDEIGLFDETFFAYLEDVDLAWRARWSGWRAVYVPSARVYHHHSTTLRESSPSKTYLLARNKLWLLARNYPMPHLILYLPLILFYEILSQLYAGLNRRGRSALRGRMAGLAVLAQALRQRRKLRPRTPRPAAEVFQLLQPAAPPWKVHRRYRHLSAVNDPPDRGPLRRAPRLW